MTRKARVTTAIRFDPALHESLVETADALDVSLNWLVNRLVTEALQLVDLTTVPLTRPPT